MEKVDNHWYLSTSPWRLLAKSSWLLFPAILALLSYEVAESSVLAKHGDNSLTLFGFILPLTTLMSAFAIAISVRSNMILVKELRYKHKHITTLLLFAACSAIILSGILFLTQQSYYQLMGFENWLMQFSIKQQRFFEYELNAFVNYKTASLIALVFIWQISSVLRALGQCKLSAAYLLSWMLCKLTSLYLFIDPASKTLISELGYLHFSIDITFAVLGLTLLLFKEKLSLEDIEFSALLQDKTTALILIAQQLIPPLSLAIIMAIAARFDQNYIGAFALIFRLEPLLLLVPMVLTASLPAAMGVNYWAGLKERSESLFSRAFYLVMVCQVVVAVLIYVFKADLIATLCPDCKQVAIIKQYLIILPLSYCALGIAILYPSCLNALGKAKQSLTILCYHRLVFIPLFAYFGLQFSHQNGVFFGLFAAHLLVALLILKQLKMSAKKQKNNTKELAY